MAVMDKIKTVDGGSQMRAEFINHVWSVPLTRLTGIDDTIARTPIDYFAAWKQMVAEYTNYLFSIPASMWTGCLDTVSLTSTTWFDAWQEMCGIPMRLDGANRHFKLERYATDRILVAQQESRYGHRLVVLTHQPYRIIEVRPGNVDRYSLVVWEDA